MHTSAWLALHSPCKRYYVALGLMTPLWTTMGPAACLSSSTLTANTAQALNGSYGGGISFSYSYDNCTADLRGTVVIARNRAEATGAGTQYPNHHWPAIPCNGRRASDRSRLVG